MKWFFYNERRREWILNGVFFLQQLGRNVAYSKQHEDVQLPAEGWFWGMLPLGCIWGCTTKVILSSFLGQAVGYQRKFLCLLLGRRESSTQSLWWWLQWPQRAGAYAEPQRIFWSSRAHFTLRDNVLTSLLMGMEGGNKQDISWRLPEKHQRVRTPQK